MKTTHRLCDGVPVVPGIFCIDHWQERNSRGEFSHFTISGKFFVICENFHILQFRVGFL